MNGCRACFIHDGPIAITTEPPSLGDCDFCGCRGAHIWDVTIWADHFARLVDMYTQTDDNTTGSRLEARIQNDWNLFALPDPDTTRAFLKATLPATSQQLLRDDVLVAPRYDIEGNAANHKTNWDAFRHELIAINRYFPTADLDHDFLEELVLRKVRTLAQHTRLYRGRVSPTPTPHPASQMGAPPAHLVTGGRGNPVGIPHLYLAGNETTCLKESRAQNHGYVTVAEFVITRHLNYLDLAYLKPDNPFTVSSDKPDALMQSLVATEFLTELARELAVPTRPGENQIEYVPTQYLCEFVKSLGVHGIRYNSSLEADGWNIVLFDPTTARQEGPGKTFEIIKMEFDYIEH